MTENQVQIGDRSIEVWPRGQAVHSLGSPKLLRTRFADTGDFHPALVRCIRELADGSEAPEATGKLVCGRKFHDLASRGIPEAALLEARALALFRLVFKSASAAVDNSWATLYRSGDFCLPHSHLRAEASVIYLLDPGDERHPWKGNGRLGFADPRLPICCQDEPGRMTTPQFPELVPGDMVIFPGEVIHLVNPYEGERPRITLSWNINRRAIPGAGAHHAGRRRRAAESGSNE